MYPLSPHLNHMGDDVSRSLLTFAEPKRIGRRGLFWLKVHIANLFGVDKISFEDRVAWVEARHENIMNLGRDPLNPTNFEFWSSSESPWQTLSAATEYFKSYSSSSPEDFATSLPVHQDGSCNGLQHYAALGRDKTGGVSVNVLPSETPQDVYSLVLELVRKQVSVDACKGIEEAKICIENDLLQRKVVKQTIMTICYGVTTVGAIDQVASKLEGMMRHTSMESKLRKVASYIARYTLKSIDEVFAEAMQIKKWLDVVSKVCNSHGMVVSWVSPIGLPCSQPYRQSKTARLVTSLQRINLRYFDGECRTNKSKQRMGFPPNFIHSLDASHLLFTAEKCLLVDNIQFAAVHDSFWTHPSTVDTMNRRIREEFVSLYSGSILTDLYESIRMRLGSFSEELPPPPPVGDLDITAVLDSPYFFD